MKLRHHVPRAATDRLANSAEVDESYQREVDRSTESAERLYRRLVRAQERLSTAEVRRAGLAGRPTRGDKTRELNALAEAVELVERRRAEVVRLMLLMRSAPSSAQHRGRGHGKRPVPGQALI